MILHCEFGVSLHPQYVTLANSSLSGSCQCSVQMYKQMTKEASLICIYCLLSLVTAVVIHSALILSDRATAKVISGWKKKRIGLVIS